MSDMNNKKYIDYLNTLHNYNAQNENAYGENNIENTYFKKVMVPAELGKSICEKLKDNQPCIFILTGHAGDGKTSIMYQVLNEFDAEFNPKEKQSEIVLPNQKKCLCIKDFSELPEDCKHPDSRLNVLKKSIDMVKEGNFAFMVANTGPLINTFGELFDNDNNESEKFKIQLINQMDNNKDNIEEIAGIPICVINMINVDNTVFSKKFLEKINQKELWEDCRNCSKKIYCHIHKNHQLILENKSRVYEFIYHHFIWLTEYGTRLTIRSMIEQLAYMITGGISCEEVKEEETYKYLFSNLFFGYIGTKKNNRAQNIIAIDAANQCGYDHKRMRTDEKLLVRKEYDHLFNNTVSKIIKDAEKENAFVDGWVAFLRRTYFFMNIVTDKTNIKEDYEDIFSKQFKRFLAMRQGEKPAKSDKDLILDALSMIYIGTTCKHNEIPLTLSRESGIMQNVQLVTGRISIHKIRIEVSKIKTTSFNANENNYKLQLMNGNENLNISLSLPLLDYFEELKNGVISTNIDPQLSHGVENLKAKLAEKLKEDDNEYNKIEFVVLKNNELKNVQLELTEEGIITEY